MSKSDTVTKWSFVSIGKKKLYLFPFCVASANDSDEIEMLRCS